MKTGVLLLSLITATRLVPSSCLSPIFPHTASPDTRFGYQSR